MSAWYVLSSVGLYQVEPAGGKYIIGSPDLRQGIAERGQGQDLQHHLQGQQQGEHVCPVMPS